MIFVQTVHAECTDSVCCNC